MANGHVHEEYLDYDFVNLLSLDGNGAVEDYTRLRTKGLYLPGRPGQGGPRILSPLEEIERAHD